MVRFLKNWGIVVTKGDTVKMPIIVTNNDGSIYHVQKDDVINFGLKKEYTDAECLIEKIIDNDELMLVLSHEDTKKLEVGIGYKYDIQILRNKDEVHTFISGMITVTNEVYDKEKEEETQNPSGDNPLDPSNPSGGSSSSDSSGETGGTTDSSDGGNSSDSSGGTP